jgi:L-ascorbate metabolism protein UlaG (beta-lactamase superfamily)
MNEPLSFRWLGVQGLELHCDGQVLAIDPFFTRPPARNFFSRVYPDLRLAERLLPRCDYILVTHTHYDHVLDVPALAQQSGAAVYGPANAGRLLELSGVPGRQYQQVQASEHLSLGPFEVDVFPGQHVRFPGDGFLFGAIKKGLRVPLRPVDYPLDQVFGYFIQAQGLRTLFCPGPSMPADILFAGVAYGPDYYRRLLAQAAPRLFIPLHWDNFLLPLDRPPRELAWPGRMSLKRLERLVEAVSPHTKFIPPERLEIIEIADLLK